MRRILSKFSIFELLVISMAAALGIAVKPIIQPLVRLITGPSMIPGGVIAGGIYMMFLVLAYGITRKPWAGTLTAIVQAFIVMITGIGSHGPMTILTYTMPGVAVDLVMFLFYWRAKSGRPRPSVPACFCGGIAANVTGSLLVGVALFDIPFVPMLLALSASSLSGGLGGILAYSLIKQIYALELIVNEAFDGKYGKYDNDIKDDNK